MDGWTQFNPDGTSEWVRADEVFANIYDTISDAAEAIGEFVATAEAGSTRGRTSKSERRRAKRILRTHRRMLRGLVDDLNPLGELKRRYTGTTTVAAMARDLRSSCPVSAGCFCPPWVTTRMNVTAVYYPVIDTLDKEETSSE